MNFDNIKMTYRYTGFNQNANMPNMNGYTVTLTYNAKRMIVNYYMGSALKESDLTINAVMHSLLSDEIRGMDFEDFCSDFGYDSDSIKAKKIYNACVKNTDKLYRVFTNDELESMREQLQDY